VPCVAPQPVMCQVIDMAWFTRALRRRGMNAHGEAECQAGPPRPPAEGTGKLIRFPRKPNTTRLCCGISP